MFLFNIWNNRTYCLGFTSDVPTRRVTLNTKCLHCLLGSEDVRGDPELSLQEHFLNRGLRTLAEISPSGCEVGTVSAGACWPAPLPTRPGAHGLCPVPLNPSKHEGPHHTTPGPQVSFSSTACGTSCDCELWRAGPCLVISVPCP